MRPGSERALVGLVALVGLAGLWGCGSSSSDAASTGPASPSTVAMTSATTEEPARFSPSREYRWGLKSANGLTADLSVEFGTRIRASEVATELPAGFGSIEAACAADAERDALLPIRLQVTNTTDGFSITPTVEMRHDGREDGTIDIGASYSDGLTCGEWNVFEQVQWSDIASNETRITNWLLVLRGFYSPASPSGDWAAFGDDGAHLAVYDGEISDQDPYKPVCLSSTTGLVWDGDWRSMLQTHFPILDSGTGFGEAADEPLPEC